MRPLNQSLGLRKHLKGSFLVGRQIGGDVHRGNAVRLFNFLVGHGICPFMKQLDPETERIKNHIWLFLFLWVMALIFGAPPLVKYSPHWLVNIAIGVGLGVAALGVTILIYIHWPRFRDTVRVGFYEAGRLAFVTISFCCFAAPVLAIGYHIAVFAYEWLKVGHADAASFATYFNVPSADGWEGVQIIINWVWQLPIFLPLIVLTPISWFLGSAFAETANELAKEIEKAGTPR